MEVVIKNSRHSTIVGDQRALARLRCVVKARMFDWLSQFDQSPSLSIKSLGIGGSNLAARIGEAQRSIVNLHWINGEVLSIGQIAAIAGPRVWTLHDCWPFLGVNHYPLPVGIDDRYPILTRRRWPGVDFDRWVLRRKISAWTPKQFAIAPSNWIKSAALASEVAKDWDIAVIPNPVPLDRYVVLPREVARRYFNLDPNAFVMVYSGSLSSKVPIKGWNQLEEVLRHLSHRVRGKVVQLLVIGDESASADAVHGIKVRYAGRLHDDAAISLAYSAADAALVPSLLDNLPQVATEAIALGVPVVAFAQGGMSDIVHHGITGFLAASYDCVQFAAHIATMIDDPSIPRRMADSALGYARDNWSEERVARSYVSFYEEIIRRQSPKSLTQASGIA